MAGHHKGKREQENTSNYIAKLQARRMTLKLQIRGLLNDMKELDLELGLYVKVANDGIELLEIA